MVVSEPKLLGYTGPGVQLRPHTIGRRAASVGGSSTPRSAVPLATSASASAKTSREMCGGSVSPSPIHTVRFRMEQVGTERDRKMLQQALQESQAALCNEARRAGVAEALLRERTATLAAVAHYCAGVGDQSSPKRLQASKARSPGTSSTSVGSELQVELQHATLHDKLADKLAQSERQALALRQSEHDLQMKADAAVQEAEQLRAKLQMSERNAAAALLQQQTELVQLSSHMEAVQSELAGTRELLEMKTLQANRLQLDRREKETLQVELAKVQERFANKVEETKHLREAKRELEVKLLSYKEHHGVGEDGQLSRIAELEVKVDKLSQQVANTEIELGAQQGNKAELEDCNKALKDQLDKAHLQRMELHNTIQELKGNIRVFCRVRPTKDNHPVAAQTHDYNKVSLGHAGETYTFSFDKVFGPASEQIDVYDEVSGLVQSALDGYKVSIFAYGQTGSGKTYTMQGTSGDTAESGLIPRSLMTIFQATEEMKLQGWSWSVQVSFMEVYNETLRDLLRGSGDAAAGPTDGHVIVQDEAWGAMVTGMTCVEVDSVDKINQLMVKAAKQRAVGETNMNATSSRSHSIFALYLKGCNPASGTEIHGALHMVDLAGSERLDKSGASGERLKETQNINKSLSSLADVFAAKAEGRSHIPFRNSKLTYLMEPCLSGHGKTLMLVTIQPETHSAHESLCSLRFAKQVSQCNTGGRPRRSIKTMERTPTCKRLNSQANSKRLGHMSGTQSMKCPRGEAQEDKVLGTESCPVQGHGFFPLRRNAESAENIGSVERTSPERGSPRLRTSQSLGTKRGSSTPRC
mmetsp:Transcript_15973/g.29226  ORF Transcript_15973/g.29226 Transcript_15973/m.29226 type:complete len:812 (-) Transcript_15973:69-2504(-)